MARARKDPRQRTVSCMARARDAAADGRHATYRAASHDFRVPSRTTGETHTVRVLVVGPHPVAHCDCQADWGRGAPAGGLACWHAAAVMFGLADRDLAWFDGEKWRGRAGIEEMSARRVSRLAS